MKKLLSKEITLKIKMLINDEFGNFIIQHVINLKIKEYNDHIFNHIKENLVELSKLKFASNVIDKVLII